MKITRYRSIRDVCTSDVLEVTQETLVSILSDFYESPTKDTPGWSPALFSGSRSDKNVEELYALVFDVDKINSDQMHEALDHIQDLGIRHFVHTSHSHNPPDHVSLRVVIFLSKPVKAQDWRAFYRKAARYLGIHHESKCENESRFWYLPSHKPGAEHWCDFVDGELLDVDVLLSKIETAQTITQTTTSNHKPTGISSDSRPASPRIVEHFRKLLSAHGPAIEGQTGDAHTYKACAMSLDYGLSHSQAMEVLSEWNKNNIPPWEESDLARKLENADAYATGYRGFAGAALELQKETPQIIAHKSRSLRLSELMLRDRPPITTYRTAFHKLNELIGGGIKTRTLAVVLGPPGAGKSAFAVTMAIQMAEVNGVPVLYVSTELESEEIGIRVAASKMNTSWTLLESGILISKDAIRQSVEALNIYAIGAEALPNVDELFEVLEHEIAEITERFGVAPIVVIDYMQDLARGGDGDLRCKIGDIATNLRKMAQDKNCAIIPVSSVSRSWYGPAKQETMRASEYADVYLSAAKESGDVDYAAATVLFLDVDSGQAIEGKRPARIAVAKARRGQTGFSYATFNGAMGKWEESPESEIEFQKRKDKKSAVESDNIEILEKKIVDLLTPQGVSHSLRNLEAVFIPMGHKRISVRSAANNLLQKSSLVNLGTTTNPKYGLKR